MRLLYLLLLLAQLALAVGDKKLDKETAERMKQIEKLTGEQIAELVILAYGGRPEWKHVRNNGILEGNIRLLIDNREITGKIVRKFIRKDGPGEDQTRIDVELPAQKLTFGYNGYTVWAARDGLGFTPSPDAEASFLASLKHNHDALIYYRERESKVAYVGFETIVGIPTVVLDLTHRDGSKTRFYVSVKTYRILHLEYEVVLSPGATATKFKESFFDFRPVQNTLLPMRVVLYEEGRFVQEIQYSQVKFHTKIEEDEFLTY
ncbi:MAG: hypothetical protein RMM17_03210 [Acidobacteriota bacterium]|nr:hypothetical protein [Blastocatellia bacterium]MDW8411678.1 hypothetical protein [Acidobacteriota bacterium]